MSRDILSITDDAPRRGRPSAAADRGRRLNHIRAATLLLSGAYPPDRVAALFDCSRRCVYDWAHAALSYPDPEAEALRRSRAGRRWTARVRTRDGAA